LSNLSSDTFWFLARYSKCIACLLAYLLLDSLLCISNSGNILLTYFFAEYSTCRMILRTWRYSATLRVIAVHHFVVTYSKPTGRYSCDQIASW